MSIIQKISLVEVEKPVTMDGQRLFWPTKLGAKITRFFNRQEQPGRVYLVPRGESIMNAVSDEKQVGVVLRAQLVDNVVSAIIRMDNPVRCKLRLGLFGDARIYADDPKLYVVEDFSQVFIAAYE